MIEQPVRLGDWLLIPAQATRVLYRNVRLTEYEPSSLLGSGPGLRSGPRSAKAVEGAFSRCRASLDNSQEQRTRPMYRRFCHIACERDCGLGFRDSPNAVLRRRRRDGDPILLR